MRLPSLAIFLVALHTAVRATSGVILLDSGDPARNTTTPGDNSGWQYEGNFGGFVGTPIAPLYFVTAKHIGGVVNQAFTFHGETYMTTAAFPDPATDLQIWKVDHAFPIYAPLYRGSGTEPGKELRVFGCGTERGAALTRDNPGDLRGWQWGAGTYIQRWGSNVVTAIYPNGNWPFLRVEFNNPGLPSEAHLSVGDSGGGVFILQDGLWRLAGVNYAVDDLYSAPNANAALHAALFDCHGYYALNDDNTTFTQVPGPGPVPTSFYSTETAARLVWIQGVTGADPAVLPTEDLGHWQRGYFTPDQLSAGTVSGPDADPDADGMSNLLEFAFNLDPTYAEPVTMTAGTGLRGLPLTGTTTVGGELRLTLEFVRRTTASGSGITYTPLFSSGLDARTYIQPSNGTEVVTPINARWERVKVTDTVLPPANERRARFGRVIVTQAVPTPPTAQARAGQR